MILLCARSEHQGQFWRGVGETQGASRKDAAMRQPWKTRSLCAMSAGEMACPLQAPRSGEPLNKALPAVTDTILHH